MASNWPNYDEVQRQIEKDRIREQIIAEEIARRRILEEEVLRELMMEKEAAFRSLEPSTMSFGYSFRNSPYLGLGHSRIPSKFGRFDEIGLRGSEHLPFQRDPDQAAVSGPRLVSNGIQPLLQPTKETIVLAKPETNVCGQKRKTLTPEVDCEGNDISSNKKLKAWNCVLCNVVSTSEIDFNTHMQGRKHRAKVTQETSCGTTSMVKKCNEKPFTVLVRTSDPGANKACKAGGESSGSVHDETAENQMSVQKNIITYPRSDDKASGVDLRNNGDTPGKAMLSAKSSEKSNFWCEMCKVGATCANDMAAHEAGKKHLAKLLQYRSAKDMSISCSTKPLYMEKGAQGINGGDALLKETEKEITQNRQEIPFIPFEMSKMPNANEVVTSRDNGSINVLHATVEKGLSDATKDAGLVVVETRSLGASPVAKSCSLSSETSNTAMGSTRDPGVKIAFKADGKPKSSENEDSVAAVAEKQNSTENLNDKTDPTSIPKATDVGSNGNGDTSGPQTTQYWCEMCKVGVSSAEMMASHEGGKKHLAKLRKEASSSSESYPSKPLSMEKDAQGINGGAVLAKEIEETEQEVTQNKLESNVIPSELEVIKTTIHDTSRGEAKEAELVVQKTVDPSPEESIITFGIKKAIEDEQGRCVESTEKGDATGPEATQPSAKSCEKFKFWYQMSQVETHSAEVLCDDKLYEDPCTFPDVAWFIEEVAEDVIDEDVLSKGAKETGKDAMQDG